MDSHTWQQVELLMQPALIRLIDNIRKQLERSDWSGTYRTIENWPEGTTPEVQAKVLQLQQQLEAATPEQSAELSDALADLPQPELIYQLCLQKQDHQFEVSLWDLCYEICLRHYSPPAEHPLEEAEVDDTLIDQAGEVDWYRLDAKARQTVEKLFNQLAMEQP